MTGLFEKVIKGEYPPIPRMFSRDLSIIIGQLLKVEPSARPDCSQMLKSKIIKRHLANYNHVEDDLQESSLIGAIKVSDNIKDIAENLPKPNYVEHGSEPTPGKLIKKNS